MNDKTLTNSDVSGARLQVPDISVVGNAFLCKRLAAREVSSFSPDPDTHYPVNLPQAAHAVVERRKVTEYLLGFDHPEGSGKAEFFSHFGFAPDAWESLAEALIAHANMHPVSSVAESKFGVKYRIDGELRCPDGRFPAIRTVWIIDAGTDAPRLVTAHPL